MSLKPVVKPTLSVARTHRGLVVWQVSMELVADVYHLATHLPVIERYGIATQLRRAALSIPLNIAEGFGRKTRRELARFLTIAEGSLRELQTLLEIAVLRRYFAATEAVSATNLSNRVGFLLHRLRRSTRIAP